MTLREWQIKRLEALDHIAFDASRYVDRVSVVIYTFPPAGREEEMFRWIMCSILHTWAILGKLNTVIVASSCFPAVARFAAEHEDVVDLQINTGLIPGNIKTMSLDCIKNLHARFSTPHCLIIQDDGFPLKDSLGNFLDRYDFVGAPIISDGWKRQLAYSIGMGSFNGGFSLRSRRLCEYASRSWFSIFSKFMDEDHRHLGEDFYYTTLLKFLPITWLRFRFPPMNTAFRFSIDGLDGHVTIPKDVEPFGFHGKYTA